MPASQVWICSGQSNMEFSVAESYGYDGKVGGLIPTAGSHPGLRLYAVQKNASTTPVTDPIDLQYSEGWVTSTPESVCGAEFPGLDGYNPPANTTAYCAPHCGPSSVVKSFARKTWGYFSAVCFATGAALLRDTGRPQGMLETCWGGTPIEDWLPNMPDHQHTQAHQARARAQVQAEAEAQAQQAQGGGEEETPAPRGDGGLYNGMVAPFLQVPIKGALWYQGYCRLQYECHFLLKITHLVY